MTILDTFNIVQNGAMYRVSGLKLLIFRDACVTRGYAYTWCNKRRLSKIGTCSDSDHCSITANVTSTGDGYN